MDPGNTPTWDEMSMFANSHFDDPMGVGSPFPNSAFTDFTNMDVYGDSPLPLRTSSKSGPEAATMGGASHSHGGPAESSASTESSQDSASDTSSRRRKRKTESASPISNPVTEIGNPGQVKQEDAKQHMDMDMQPVRSYDHFSQPMHQLSLEQSKSYADTSMGPFDFSNSAASSPIQPGDFNSAMSLDAQVNMPPATISGGAQFHRDSPVQTINPGMFAIGGSRDQSPTTNLMFNQTSPNALFSTPASDSPETFSSNQAWNQTLGQTPQWPGDFAGQLTSPGGIAFTPSPGPNGHPSAGASRGVSSRMGRSPLHIAPISTKSRVETQINVVMTLEKPPRGIEHLHLPLHTIAKSKLLAKEEYERDKVLELHTMLVCTSAMHNPQNKEKAMQRAAAQNNEEIQKRAEVYRELSDDEKNDMKNVEEVDKPANGGEVRICSNCIQRERKRAGRKKTKREEEQQHWERFETERVVVFNSNEYLPFKECETATYPQRDTGADGEQYIPPDGALHVTAAMRIACYCRHQSEKEGFQVIFTMKDQQGNVVAQQMSDSILITDDHKTHPQSFSATVPSEGFYQSATYLPNGLPMSQSMVDMSAHVHPFPSSRSAGNLAALGGYNNQYTPNGHVQQISGTGFVSDTISAAMTPTTLSRPGSPTNAGQAGPNKKRKSSTFHRKVPSGLTMTPRVDTSQPQSSNLPSAVSMASQFSPNGTGFPSQMNQSYMTIPNNNGPAQFFGSGPPTPSENAPLNFSQTQVDMSRIQSNQAYFSHPSSTVPSRTSSPVQQTRANMAAYARQHPIQTSTNTMGSRPQMYPSAPGSSGNDGTHLQFPSITRITPNEGPVSGGTEVAVFGDNFVAGVQVQFGEQLSPTQVLSPSSLITISPPGRAGSVHVSILPPPGSQSYPTPASKPVFRYTQYNEEMMVMALKFLSEQQYGSTDTWQTLAQSSASQFIQSRVSRAGIGQQPGGYPGNRMAEETGRFEETALALFGAVKNMSDRPRQPNYELTSSHGATMLTRACSLGLHRVVAAVLAGGTTPDTRDIPSMHAALHGHAKIIESHLVRGADATFRGVKGYSAIGLAPMDLREPFVQVLLSTRRRNSRPSVQTYTSFSPVASSYASWDVESASFYESEIDVVERDSVSHLPSRRPSMHLALSHAGSPRPKSCWEMPCIATTLAWRDAWTAHVHALQEIVSNLHLPPFPNLPVTRGLSSLAPCKLTQSFTQVEMSHPPATDAQQPARKLWETFSASASNSMPRIAPPASDDTFPDRRKRTAAVQAVPSKAFQSAAVNGAANEKCNIIFDRDRSRAAPSVSISGFSGSFAACEPSKADHAVIPSWLWMPLLAVLTSMIMHLGRPHVSTNMLPLMGFLPPSPMALVT